MTITKFGHACLLVEENGVYFLIDPGSFSEIPTLDHVDAILVTHEHQDHLDQEKVRLLLEQHPTAVLITHASVAEKLEGIDSARVRVLTSGASIEVRGVSVESQGTDHAIIYGPSSPCQNTGFMIAGTFYHPGDSFHVPTGAVDILALPTAGPWMKLAEAIDFAKAVHPRVALSIHDAIIAPQFAGMISRIVGGNIETDGITFHTPQIGVAENF